MFRMSPTMTAFVAFFTLAIVIGSVSAGCKRYEVHKATEHEDANGKYKKEKDIAKCNGKWVYVNDDADSNTFLYYVTKIETDDDNTTINGWAIGKKNCNEDPANQWILGKGTGNIAYPDGVNSGKWYQRKEGKWVESNIKVTCHDTSIFHRIIKWVIIAVVVVVIVLVALAVCRCLCRRRRQRENLASS